VTRAKAEDRLAREAKAREELARARLARPEGWRTEVEPMWVRVLLCVFFGALLGVGVFAFWLVLSLAASAMQHAGASEKGTPARPHHYGVTQHELLMARNVAICEEGGWRNAHGPLYYGALGFTPENWQQFRYRTFPRRADLANKYQQTYALVHLINHYGISWPDQDGACHAY